MKKSGYHGKNNVSGTRIQQFRKIRELTQEQLAVRMELEGIAINQTVISKIEAGDRLVTDYELAIIAKILQVRLDDLIIL